jgi:hypothetical protein
MFFTTYDIAALEVSVQRLFPGKPAIIRSPSAAGVRQASPSEDGSPGNRAAPGETHPGSPCSPRLTLLTFAHVKIASKKRHHPRPGGGVS